MKNVKKLIVGEVEIEGNPRIVKLEPQLKDEGLIFKPVLANNCNECPYKYYWKDENPNWREWVCNAGYKLKYSECAFPTIKDFFRVLDDYIKNKSDTTLNDVLNAFERGDTDVKSFIRSPKNYILVRVE